MTTERAWRDLIAKASVVAEGSTSKIDAGKTKRSKPGGNMPTGQGHSLLDRMRARWEGCEGDRDRERAVAWAEGELRRIHRKAPELTAKQTHYWIVEHTQGVEYREVAEQHGISEKVVWKMRKEAGLDPRHGRPKAA